MSKGLATILLFLAFTTVQVLCVDTTHPIAARLPPESHGNLTLRRRDDGSAKKHLLCMDEDRNPETGHTMHGFLLYDMTKDFMNWDSVEEHKKFHGEVEEKCAQVGVTDWKIAPDPYKQDRVACYFALNGFTANCVQSAVK